MKCSYYVTNRATTLVVKIFNNRSSKFKSDTASGYKARQWGKIIDLDDNLKFKNQNPVDKSDPDDN